MGNELRIVAGKLGTPLCPFGKEVLYIKDYGYSQEMHNNVKQE